MHFIAFLFLAAYFFFTPSSKTKTNIIKFFVGVFGYFFTFMFGETWLREAFGLEFNGWLAMVLAIGFVPWFIYLLVTLTGESEESQA